MKNSNAIRVVMSVVVSAFGTSSVMAAASFPYDTPQVGYLSIHPMSMSPDGDTSAGDYFVSWDSGLTSDSYNCFNTGVNLPNGAIATFAQVWLTSNDQSELYVELNRLNLATGASTRLVGTDLPDDTNTRVQKTVSISAQPGTIKNGNFAYGLGICVGVGTTFHGARIRYVYDNAGD